MGKINITNNQRDILDHTMHRAPCGYYCGDSADMQELIRLGLMVSVGKKSFVPDEYFALTGAGREFIRRGTDGGQRSARPAVKENE